MGVARARQAQIGYWRELFLDGFDSSYVASAQRIGRVDSRIGLEPSRYIGGDLIVLVHLNGLISRITASRLNPRAGPEKMLKMTGAASPWWRRM